MRISTSQIFNQSLKSMQRQQSELQISQSQLSSGLRLQKPSDDPTGMGRALNLESSLASLDQYARNNLRAGSSLNLQEQTLASTAESVQRLRELALQGGSPGNDANERRLLAEEVEAQINTLLSLVNTRDENGEYIFAGSRTDQPPFVRNATEDVLYQGSQVAKELALSEGTIIKIRDPGDALFIEEPGSVFVAAKELRELLTGNSNNITSGIENVLERLGKSQETLDAQRAVIGARLNQAEMADEINAGLKFQLQTVLSQTRDVDYLEVISRFNQQVTALEAVQKTFISVSELSLLKFL
jgi:flagellar hook-associated protein 3 FlgL